MVLIDGPGQTGYPDQKRCHTNGSRGSVGLHRTAALVLGKNAFRQLRQLCMRGFRQFDGCVPGNVRMGF
ncbi:MAG: hypothetical protein V3U27_16540 [Candidatus Tectomicrobia bacterium]